MCTGKLVLQHPPRGAARLDPIELGLQWRVSYRKDYVGASALAEARRRGAQRHLTCVKADALLVAGDAVFFESRHIGSIVNAGYSPLIGAYVAAAVLDVPFAEPGIACYAVEHGGVRVPIRTVSPPLLNNRSLYVSPMRHGYATRAGDAFPPVIR